MGTLPLATFPSLETVNYDAQDIWNAICFAHGKPLPSKTFEMSTDGWIKSYILSQPNNYLFYWFYQNHQQVNRALDVETCCEEIDVKSFVKLQFCLEEVREIERTKSLGI